MPDWYELRCTTTVSDEDVLSERLNELGAAGISIEAPGAPFLPDEPSAEVILRAFFSNHEAAQAARLSVEQGSEHAGNPQVILHQPEDWIKKVKESFQPLEVASGVWVAPSWQDFKRPDGELVMVIDPGMAFGTGAHPTTRLCCQAILESLGKNAARPTSMLDVGCGSGILSFLAALKGVQTVRAIDIDPPSIESTIKFAEVNGVGGKIEADTTDISLLEGGYDLIAANILLEPLGRMREDLVRLLNPGGELILSGILEYQLGELEQTFCIVPLKKNNSRVEEDWAMLSLKKE